MAELTVKDQVQELLGSIGRGGTSKRAAIRPDDPEEQKRFQRERALHPLEVAWDSVPERFKWARFDSPILAERVRPPERIEEARAVVGSLLLCGPSGSGKTSLAVACMRELLQRARLAIDAPRSMAATSAYLAGTRAFFCPAYDLAKAGIYSPLGAMPRLVDRAIGATLLVLDDLGMDVEVFRTSGSAVREVLYERHAAYKPTIVTTYLTAPDLAKHYGQGLSRRLGEGTVLVLGGSDG